MARTSQAELIFNHALKHVQTRRTADGHAWAVMPTGPFGHRGDLIHSSDFREYLAVHFQHEHEIFPSRSALTHAIRMLAAHAVQQNEPAIETFTRIGHRGHARRPDAILIDLANPAHDVLEITSEARRIMPNHNCHFFAAADTRPLPHPVDSALTPAEHLRDILHLPEPALQAAQDWLLAALRPTGPYPALIITGPEGSGKTTLARALRDIIDPAAALPPLPRTTRQLHAHALRHRVVALDHIASLPKEISESVSRLATGTSVALPTRNVVDDPKPIPIARPVIITAPAGHRSFPANAIHIRLEAIARENLRDEATIQQQLQEAAPALLGAICTILVGQVVNLRPIVNRAAEAIQKPASYAATHAGTGSDSPETFTTSSGASSGPVSPPPW